MHVILSLIVFPNFYEPINKGDALEMLLIEAVDELLIRRCFSIEVVKVGDVRQGIFLPMIP